MGNVQVGLQTLPIVIINFTKGPQGIIKLLFHLNGINASHNLLEDKLHFVPCVHSFHENEHSYGLIS